MPRRGLGRQPRDWEQIEKRLASTPDERLLTASDIGQTLGLKRGKAFLLLNSGELPTIRIGSSLRVPASEFERWLDSEGAKRITRDRRFREDREHER